ncbi:MAG: FAD-binding oxidoreductase [Candidatus Kinetoplastibacterium crithidii]|nr:MAG: FAD-binding oxidoreductase [Candidatus Kinetoplastibacterium crithidii]
MSFLNSLASIVGSNYVLTGENAIPFLSDWRGRYKGDAIAIVRPSNIQSVIKIVQLCKQYNIAIVPQGGNTGLCGGSIPNSNSKDSIIISTTRLNQIRDIDLSNNSIVVEAGCTLHKLQCISLENNRYFPLSLASEGTCTIGGNLATNAGGTQVLRYGNIRELTLGIEVVSPDGDIIDLLRALRKDNTGYSLRDLYIGSEGTLGIITAATLKLFPIRDKKWAILVPLSSVEDAIILLTEARSVFDASLTAFELISQFCLRLSLNFLNDKKYRLDSNFIHHPWFVLLEISAIGDIREVDDFMSNRIKCFLEKCIDIGYIDDAIISFDNLHFASLWHLRESIPLAEKDFGKGIKHDISLPISLIPSFISDMEKSLDLYFSGVQIVVFGHLGDGNLHYNVFRSINQSEEDLLSLQSQIYDLVHSKVHALGGSISAEHGIGQLKVSELQKYKNLSALDLMLRLKKSIDPNNIMNPGKILDI